MIVHSWLVRLFQLADQWRRHIWDRAGLHDRFIYTMDYSCIMATGTICIPTDEYERLKKKAKIADDTLVQLKLSLDDLRHGRVHKFESKTS